MSPPAKFIRGALGLLTGGVFSIILWTLWMALALLLAGLIYILTSNELAIPQFGLRKLERWLAETGVKATFGRTSFDPTGRLLIEDARIFLPNSTEPVVVARTLFIRFDSRSLLNGRFVPQEISLSGASAFVPSMLSGSGQPEEFIRSLHVTLHITAEVAHLVQLNARIAGANLSASGQLPLTIGTGQAPLGEIMAILVRGFPTICRQAMDLAAVLAPIEEPTVELTLLPPVLGVQNLRVTVLSREVNLPPNFEGKIAKVRATTEVRLTNADQPAVISITAEDLWLGSATQVHGITALAFGRWNFATATAPLDLRELAITAETSRFEDFTAKASSAQIYPLPGSRLAATIVAELLDSRLALNAEADLATRSARIRFSGEIAPTVLANISRRAGTDVRRFYDFETLSAESAEVTLSAGWKFAQLTARIRVPRMRSYGLAMEDGRVRVELSPQRFYAPEAFARIGQNSAQGTYEHDLTTHQYRFLLDGKLRPLDISPWFREWWPNFFKQLEFPLGPPEASVDVSGSWRTPAETSVFIFADTLKPIMRGTRFEQVRVRLFIRPAFYDGLEVFATRGEGSARGTFRLTALPGSNEWQKLEIGLTSNVDLASIRETLGPKLSAPLAAISYAGQPEVKFQGTFFGPAAPAGSREHLRIEARSVGDFRLYQFPIEDVSFIATIDGDSIAVDDIGATFAGGTANGHARLEGTGDQRSLGFDLSLQNASLGQATQKLQEFFALRAGRPAGPPGKFIHQKANVRLDLAASAEGRASAPLSFHGEGNASLRGPEIGEVPLLGQLSELLKFTALRFNEARGNFKINETKLHFSQLEIRGANSAIEMNGDYALDRSELDFNAKIFPFHESDSLLKTVVGAVLTPFSNAFEVRLTGPLEAPQWAFVLSPGQLLKGLIEGEGSPDKKPDPMIGSSSSASPASTPTSSEAPFFGPAPRAPVAP
jgi:AsmA-like C-terminal region